jgi:hypothetical protein
MERTRRSFPTTAGCFFTRPSNTHGSRRRSMRAPCFPSFGQNAPAWPPVPSPLAVEGTTVWQRTRMGGGVVAATTPHPSSRVAASSCPLPQPKSDSSDFGPLLKAPELGQARVRVGEGTITATKFAARRRTVAVSSHLTMSNSPSRSRGAIAPGFLRRCFTHPETEGWAERRETFGCVRGTRWACHSASRRA